MTVNCEDVVPFCQFHMSESHCNCIEFVYKKNDRRPLISTTTCETQLQYVCNAKYSIVIWFCVYLSTIDIMMYHVKMFMLGTLNSVKHFP